MTQKLPSAYHGTTLSGYIFSTKACIDNRKKNLLSNSISSICPYNMVNFRPLTAEIDWRVWGTPAYFNACRVLASLLQRRCLTEVNQTLHDAWPSPALLHCYIHFRGLLPPNGILPTAFTLRPSIEFSYFDSVTVRHCSNEAKTRHALKYICWGAPNPPIVRQTLRCGTRNGITELSHTGATYIGLGGHHVGHRPTF